MQLNQKEIQEAIQTCEGLIVITTHHKPDADALGSSLALCNLLSAMGKKAMVIAPTDFPTFLDWMPGRPEVMIFEESQEESRKLVSQAELIFCLDFNDLKRINALGDLVAQSSAKKIMIDHHREPDSFADFYYHSIETSSTCELVFQFIEASPFASGLNKDIASCLYAGIMTDTGGFRHGNTSANTFRVAASLMELGANNVDINQQILDQFSLKRFQLIGFALYNRLRLISNGKVAIMSLSAEDLSRFHVQTGDTEGLVNYGLSIAGVELSALIIDRTERVKMSFRSKNKFPCNTFAKENFEGGGHYNAAGGQSEESLTETVAKFERVIVNYKEWLS